MTVNSHRLRHTLRGGTIIAMAAMLLLFSRVSIVAHGELQIQIAAMTRKIEASTNKAELYLERGELYREHQDFAAAEADYVRAAELDPQLARVDVCHALLLSDRGELEAARAMFDKALTRLPGSSEAFLGRARLFMKLGDRPAAIADYRNAMKLLRLPDPPCFRELAEALLAEGKIDEALDALDEGIKKMPVPSLQQFAFEIELNRKNHAAALARLDRIITEASRKETWLTKQAEIFLMADKPKQARASLDAAIEAIKLLPERIQFGPPIQELKARIAAAAAKADAAIEIPSRRPTDFQ